MKWSCKPVAVAAMAVLCFTPLALARIEAIQKELELLDD